MNNNVKEFIQKISKDQTLKKEFADISEKIEDGADREQAIKTYILPFAKKVGYDLATEDFEMEGELCEEELMAVSGGGGCVCFAGGAGGGTDSVDKKTYGCACVLYGQGGDGDVADTNCLCPIAGAGTDSSQ